MSLLSRLNTARDRHSWSPALLNVSISAGKFISSGSGQSRSITSFFSAASPAVSGASQAETRQKPKSFFQMKILEDLEKKKIPPEGKTEISECSSSTISEEAVGKQQ